MPDIPRLTTPPLASHYITPRPPCSLSPSTTTSPHVHTNTATNSQPSAPTIELITPSLTPVSSYLPAPLSSPASASSKMDALWMSRSGSLPTSEAPVISEDEAAVASELRRGPWTEDEDALLAGYVAAHGEGRWNELALAAGLRRTGKSCRLRWLNYLRPGVRRGGFTPREQLLILDLHSRWGNRWSKIAAQLPGRTDNEVKNYWRTRVQKHAKQLGCDVGSGRFHDAIRNLWMPRLIERIHADESAAAASSAGVSGYHSSSPAQAPAYQNAAAPIIGNCARAPSPDTASCVTGTSSSWEPSPVAQFQSSSPAMAAWSTEQCHNGCSSATSGDMFDESWSELLARANHDDADSAAAGLPDFGLGETGDNWWSLEDIWQNPLY